MSRLFLSVLVLFVVFVSLKIVNAIPEPQIFIADGLIPENDRVKVQELKAEEQGRVIRHIKGHPEGFARFGPMGYIMPQNYKSHADALRRMTLRSDDLWVVTFPRTGTTWTQEMVWLLQNNLDYDKALKIPLAERYLFLEFFSFITGRNLEIGNFDAEIIENLKYPDYLRAENVPSPRFIKTHLPLSLLPLELLNRCKVVYVARDPRDVAVSYYHHNQLFKAVDFVGDFKTYWKLFVDELLLDAPFFTHLKEAWAQRHHPNMLFLFYEDMKKDLPSTLRSLSEFLGKEYTNDQIAELCEHLDIKNFKNNESTNPSWINADSPLTFGGREGFVRKGKVGGWRDYMDDEMQTEAARWIAANLADTDLRFPSA